MIVISGFETMANRFRNFSISTDKCTVEAGLRVHLPIVSPNITFLPHAPPFSQNNMIMSEFAMRMYFSSRTILDQEIALPCEGSHRILCQWAEPELMLTKM